MGGPFPELSGDIPSLPPAHIFELFLENFLLLIAFLVYVFVSFPRLRFWPLWLFLISLVLYFIFLDFLPRLLNSLNRKAVLNFLLPSFWLFLLLSSPILKLSQKLVHKEEREEVREATEEEIETFIYEAKEEGIIEKDEDVLLRSVVEFGDTLVREIMTPRMDMACIRKDATIQKLRELIISEKYSRIPVYKDRIDNIEGIIIAKDLLEYSDEVQRLSGWKRGGKSREYWIQKSILICR